MTSATSGQVLAVTRQWLRPAIHVLLRCGVTWREFAELAKTTYVEVATEKFGKRGRPTNVSRTSVLTGLVRREIRAQRERLEQAPDAPSGYVTKASLALSTWHINPDFLDRKGQPALLTLEGDGTSFEALMRACGAGDVPASTVLKELLSAAAVRRRPDGRLQALKRNYIPSAMDEELLRLWGTVLADVATTYVHNLTRTGKMPARFERAAVNARIEVQALPEFRQFVEREGQAFLERVDAWLTAHEATRKSAETTRLGVGVYHIQD